ncbi:MAG: cytochrome c553 [Moritella dasanensis]|jgi:cytochrome c553
MSRRDMGSEAENNKWNAMKSLVLSFAMLIGLMGSAQAAGDAATGEAISGTCTACHGADGNSPASIYPKLAGQNASYIVKQLKDFQLAMQTGGEKGRNNPVMMGMAAMLTEENMQDLAAFYSAQTMKPEETPEEVVAAGELLYRGGDIERGIPGCAACHGPRGNGSETAKFPKISGQHADYIKAQLEKFSSKERANDHNGMMQDIAYKMKPADMEMISKYLGGLH